MMELRRENFLKLTKEDINEELSELNSQLYVVTSALEVDKVNLLLKKGMKTYAEKYINKKKDVGEKEAFVSRTQAREYYSTNAENLAKEFLDEVITRRGNSAVLNEIYDTYQCGSKLFRSNSCQRAASTVIYTIAAREAMLNWYKTNLLESEETMFLTAQTESLASASTSYLDNYSWKISVIPDKETPRMELTEGGTQYSGAYTAFLKPDWCLKVHEKGLATTDIAGKIVLVLDADPVTPKRVDIEGVNLFKIKVGYSLVPIGSDAWGWSSTASNQQEQREATVNNKDLYLAYIVDTNGKKIIATGKDEEWAQRTLKMRLKRTMLKSMGVL